MSQSDSGFTDLPPAPSQGGEGSTATPADPLPTLPPTVATPQRAAFPWPRWLRLPSRSTRHPSDGRPRSFGKYWGILIGISFLGGSTALGWAGWRSVKAFEDTLPSAQDVFTFSRDGTVTIIAADGTILQQQGPATREKTPLKRIPKKLLQAFMAAEDRRFYEHDGVDAIGILRASWTNLLAGEVVEGGSTITQQLARIVFLNQERSATRKLREALLAAKMERSLTKDQIAESYLNLVYLGSGAYGVSDAAWVYFGKSLDRLTLAEMATLACLAPAPSYFSPLVNPEITKERRNIVLDRMVVAGFLSAAEADAAQSEPITLNQKIPRRLIVTAPHFTSYILQELPKHLPSEVIERGGLTVETTLRPDWQTVATRAVQEAVQKRGRYQRFSQGALVAIDPRTGEIRAMVGSGDTNFTASQFNRVTQAKRQPGSTFKTFVYSAAIQAGMSPYAGYADEPYRIGGYEPKNFSGKFSGWQSATAALTKSVNIIALKVMLDVGRENVIDLARKMGIQSELKPTYSLALGASEVNLLELTAAYGTLAAKGKHFPTYGIRRIRDRRGQVIYENKTAPVVALNTNDAAIINWMLQQVVNDGTGAPAALEGRPVAGKTGTSDKARDLWFIGFIPQLVTGVWLGNDNNQPTYGASAAAAATWNDFMKEAVKGFKVETFDKLPNLSGRRFRPKKRADRGSREGQAASEDDLKRRQQEDREEEPRSGSSSERSPQPRSGESRSGRGEESRGEGERRSPRSSAPSPAVAPARSGSSEPAAPVRS
ncbi:transglycosylase domain-containing protein, partial [Limnothrix sp. PR1529]|uniref:transglycosylase domain-containing protein n=1 Tax=Limnothrix sp. PR1529 TaxID=1704291 RepID=UPI001F40C841